MSKQSAGILLYRIEHNKPQCLLAHPGGPFWAKKDAGAWSIPKGEFTDEENPLDAAKREFYEEIGTEVNGDFISLGTAKQKSGKLLYVWALHYNLDVDHVQSNTFELEWPPHSGIKKTFPEIDRAEWFTFDKAKQKINPGQLIFISQLEDLLPV